MTAQRRRPGFVDTGSPSPRVLLCPDSFKGTFSAPVVASAFAEGVSRAGGRPTSLPLADGGEGTAEVLLGVMGGTWLDVNVLGPLGHPIVARVAMLDDQVTAVVDTAAASGLTLVAEDQRNAEAASSYGTGQLIAAAAAQGARRILVACGGSATTDGGYGAVHAIHASGGLRGAKLVVLSDVVTPFERAAEVYAPQKGADPAAVTRLTERLLQLASSLPRDPRGLPRSGAAGGLSGGLWAAFDATLDSGIDVVLDMVGFEDLIAEADLIITGEGRLDAQTAEGKVVSGVLRRAGEVPVHVAAGQIAVSADDLQRLGIAQAHTTPTLADLTRAASAITTASSRASARR